MIIKFLIDDALKKENYVSNSTDYEITRYIIVVIENAACQ